LVGLSNINRPHYTSSGFQTRKKLLSRQYESNLISFDGVLFKGIGRELLYRKDIELQYRFCLLQMAVWIGVKKNDILKLDGF
jgi:hypothetical protein